MLPGGPSADLQTDGMGMPLLRGSDYPGWGGADHHLTDPVIFDPLAVIRSLDGLSTHGLSHERGGGSNVQREDGRAAGEHYHLPQCLRVRGQRGESLTGQPSRSTRQRGPAHDMVHYKGDRKDINIPKYLFFSIERYSLCRLC
jgi:hypothetical protein